MEVVRNIEKGIKEGTAVTIGMFDGVHKGHNALIQAVLHNAKEKNIKSAVFTFTNDTSLSQKCPGYITNQKVRELIFKKNNIDYLILQNFDKRFTELSPEDFFEKYIVKLLNAKALVAGADFCFGYKASGKINSLARLCQTNDIELIVPPPVCINDMEISSSNIRRMISEGDLDNANTHLGRRLTISGIVEHSAGRGKTLGFPTANIAVDDLQIMPPHGVYVTLVRIGEKEYASVTSFGSRPTFDDRITVETHILDFNADIYNEEIFIEFLGFIRNIEKYDSADALAQILASDCKLSKDYVNKMKRT